MIYIGDHACIGCRGALCCGAAGFPVAQIPQARHQFLPSADAAGH